MAKTAELQIEITPEGKIIVHVNGTVGTECLQLLKALDEINGIVEEEFIPAAALKRTTQINQTNTQTISR